MAATANWSQYFLSLLSGFQDTFALDMFPDLWTPLMEAEEVPKGASLAFLQSVQHWEK